MNRGVLDTSVLVATDAPIPGELAVSVARIAELQFGVLVAKTPEARATRLARLSAIQRRFDRYLSTTPSPTATDDSPPESSKSDASHVRGRWTC
jgi:hypothetical protein